jgi:sortase A
MDSTGTTNAVERTRAERRHRIERVKKRRRTRLLALLLLITGLWTALYPSIAQTVNEQTMKTAVEQAQEATADISDEKTDAMREAAVAYNKRLAAGDVSVGERYDETLNVGGGLMGTIDIKGIGVSLPIYHGTSDEVLLKGAGHVSTSSLPVGGASTHAAISGHAGLTDKRMFSDLGRMRKGETFTITVLGETLTYRVVSIRTVLPEETSVLNIEEGRDLVSLITCTPTGISTHRLVITGERVPDTQVEPSDGEVEQSHPSSFSIPTAVIIGIVLTLLLVCAYLVLVLRERRRREDGSDEPNESGV